ncbi:hypothetical protein TanjilG_14904 [Lupinus angustifolius]|uniref:Uncharacterized protein n=1 Tax=Lupinus angustifolius TaxID=3871 RepID=A0A1J7G6U2_LUPAN|nr:PREDICTED: uncharacterized protein LOC109328919 [Lupinus angustifolius]OIV96227.1 hypothetical protein TanjilG_14904 [Lupinus angustifolius]
MARGSKAQRGIASHQYRPTPYPLPPRKRDICEDMFPKNCSKALDKKDLEDVTCSVCMEYPHNAVLLLCSSHDNGCRPYMCGTSYRHSNCLDQYKKAYTKVISSSNGQQPQQGLISNQGVLQGSNSTCRENEVAKLSCPLCRGQVKGWTIVEPVRDYLNSKKRSCMQDNCTFSGNYRELKKHVRAEHPSACPRAIDPEHENKWRFLEREREREDVISTVTAAMPGALVLGDYVIEGHHNIDFNGVLQEEAAFDAAMGTSRNGRRQIPVEAINFFLMLHSIRQANNDLDNLSRRRLRQLSGQSVTQHETPPVDDGGNDRSSGGNDGVSLVSRLHRHGSGRVLLNRSGRRRRQREGHN